MAVNKKNYSKSIKVSESVVAELRKGTKASNIAKANAPGASVQFREAVRRFYGKDATKAMSMAGGKTVKPGARRVTSSKPSSSSATVSKPKSSSTRGGFGDAPKYNMNVGKVSAPKRAVNNKAAKPKLSAKEILTPKGPAKIALAMVPTGKAIQGIKSLAGAAKYGKAASSNLNRLQSGYTRGVVTKGELDKAKKLAEAIANRKQQLKASPKLSTAQLEKKIPSKFTPKPTPAKKAPAKSTSSKGNYTQKNLSENVKRTTAKTSAPKPKTTGSNDAQEMSKAMLDRVAGKKPIRRLGVATIAGYGAKERYKIAKGK